jgi:hypothetical protein
MPLGHNKNASLFYTFTRGNLVFRSSCTNLVSAARTQNLGCGSEILK